MTTPPQAAAPDTPPDTPPDTVADAVATATLAVPGVVRLHAGAFGEVATYLPGRRVVGVRTGRDVTEVHVVVDASQPVLGVAERVRAAVRPLVPTPVDVYLEDLDASVPGSTPPMPPLPSNGRTP